MTDWLLGGCCGAGGTLVWSASSWVPAVVAGCGAGVVALAARGGLRGRAAELGLLAGALVLLVAASAGPVWVQEGARTEEGRLVVLVDSSRSMTVREGDGRSRGDEALARAASLAGADVYSFGDGLRSGAPVAFTAGDTDLGGALAGIAQRYAGERLRGVVVLTDGLDRGGLRRRLSESPDSPVPAVPGPLTVVQVGAVGARADLAVADVRGGGFAFLRAPFTLEVQVEATGSARRSVPVTLLRDGQPAGTATASLDAQGRGVASFTLTPDQVGRFVYEASVPVDEGDAVPANNVLARAVQVVRDRVRILQVCGSPSWDQKFLRLFLKEDPSVDLVSFFILRTQADMGAGWDPDELSLIQFPYERLFSSELGTFDLVILQNFDYAPYFDRDADELLANMARYVREGGALAMVGGDRSFDLGRYAGTPVAEVLPVELGVTGDATDATAFQPRLTAGGARHPITALSGDPAENAATWERLVPLDGLNLSRGLRPGAAALLSHPGRTSPDGSPLPVLAVAEVGKGRTLALMGDSSWRWSFDEAGGGRGNQAYLRFWKNAIRWLVGDPGDQPVVVEIARESVQLGEEARVRVRARDTAFQPVPGAQVEVVLRGPGGDRTERVVADSDGVATVVVTGDQRGAWRVRATAVAPGGAPLGTASSAFTVTTRDPELDVVAPDSAFLRALAARAGGRYVGPGEVLVPLEDRDAGRVVRDRRETSLAAMPLVPALLLAATGGSWLLRRRRGLR
jgi:uncharacterized membrane protein